MIEIGDVRAYDVQEIAKELDLSAATVRTYIKQGRLKGNKVGLAYYVTEKNLQNYIEGKPQE